MKIIVVLIIFFNVILPARSRSDDLPVRNDNLQVPLDALLRCRNWKDSLELARNCLEGDFEKLTRRELLEQIFVWFLEHAEEQSIESNPMFSLRAIQSVFYINPVEFAKVLVPRMGSSDRKTSVVATNMLDASDFYQLGLPMERLPYVSRFLRDFKDPNMLPPVFWARLFESDGRSALQATRRQFQPVTESIVPDEAKAVHETITMVAKLNYLISASYYEEKKESLTEANLILVKLASHDQWWFRMYCLSAMRWPSEWQDLNLVRKLCDDKYAAVKEMATRLLARINELDDADRGDAPDQ